MTLPHIHLLLNHWPIIGLFISLALFILALIANSDDLKQTSLASLVLTALLAIPTYMSGEVSQEALKRSGLSEPLIQTHRGAALLALVFIEITGAVALLGLWPFSRMSHPLPNRAGRWNSGAVLFLAIMTAGLMTITGNTGGAIRHPEILSGQEATSIVGTIGARIVPAVSYFVSGYSRWVWPVLETLHFFGLILIVGAIGALDIRLLGFFKQLPVEPLHRLLPWGIAGFIINIVTGILFFLGMPDFYVSNITLYFKMAAMLLAGATLLVFQSSGAFRAWARLGVGEDTPPFARLVAASSLLLWLSLIVFGRYLPFTEGSLLRR